MAAIEDVEQIASSAWKIGRCAEDLAEELTGLQKTVGSQHPWGDDEPGNAFGEIYSDVLQHAIDTLGSHSGQLVTAAERLAAWAAQSTENEQAGAEKLARFGRKLER
ncbi:hypothetical protein [Flindersiella endophytica]